MFDLYNNELQPGDAVRAATAQELEDVGTKITEDPFDAPRIVASFICIEGQQRVTFVPTDQEAANPPATLKDLRTFVARKLVRI